MLCFIYFTEPTNSGCQTGALMRFAHGFFIEAKQRMRILQGHGRQWIQSGTQTADTPGLGIAQPSLTIGSHLQLEKA